MEQPDPSANTAHTPAVVSRSTVSLPPDHSDISVDTSPLLPTSPSPSGPSTDNISSSVPTFRLPRPQGDRRLTNWISSSQPEIMRPSNSQDYSMADSVMEGSIYELVGFDGESYPESSVVGSYDQASDDIHSLAGTDTGTDACTNEELSSEDEDEEEENMPDIISEESDTEIVNVHDENEDSEDDDSEVLADADRSLELPTEVFPQHSGDISRRSSISLADSHYLARCGDWKKANSAASSARKPTVTGACEQLTKQTSEHGLDTTAIMAPIATDDGPTIWSIVKAVAIRVKQDPIFRLMLIATLGCLLAPAMMLRSGDYLFSKDTTLSTVPVASVASISTITATEHAVVTSTFTSTVFVNHATSKDLQTTSSSKGVASIQPQVDHSNVHAPYSAFAQGSNEILLKIPRALKSKWLSKNAIMISVSRGGSDIPSNSTKITTVDEGFLIEIPQKEAHGTLDVSFATTHRPKVKQTFHVRFAGFNMVEAFDAGKELVKSFAQTVVDRVNDTTTWVEQTCIPAFDLTSTKASVSESITQGLKDASSAVVNYQTQFTQQFKQAINQERIFQLETELLRQAQDAQSTLSLGILRSQLTSKLWWLKIRGEDAEYSRYLAAAEPFYKEKLAEAVQASRIRAEAAKKEIRARRRQGKQESWWTFGGG